jgi:hypothetical protein
VVWCAWERGFETVIDNSFLALGTNNDVVAPWDEEEGRVDETVREQIILHLGQIVR